MDTKISEVTIATIGSLSSEDPLCIDSMSIDDEQSRHISNNWVGGDSGHHILAAVFKYPVCKTEVIGVRIDYDSSTVSMLTGDSTISGLECTNNNRMLSTTCSISQSYELSKTDSFSFSEDYTQSSGLFL